MAFVTGRGLGDTAVEHIVAREPNQRGSYRQLVTYRSTVRPRELNRYTSEHFGTNDHMVA